MLRGRLVSRSAALAVLLGACTVVAGCGGGSDSYPDVSVSSPELASSGPALSVEQWRRSVGEVCRDAATEVGGASNQLAREIKSGDGDINEGEISRRAFQLVKPVFEQQLRALAQLEPPAELADEYQGFIDSLAEELQWTCLLYTSDAADE